MIDTIYKTVLTILNKENQGYISPTEYNLLASNVQQEIFRSYFEDENLDKNKENRGISNRGYSNLPFNQRQRITPFAKQSPLSTTSITTTHTVFDKPTDLYLLEDNGVSSSTGKLISEVERSSVVTLMNTEAAPTTSYPVYEDVGKKLQVYPKTIESISLRYIRKPLEPKWTYYLLDNGGEVYNPANASFQDFELHPSEFSNIVIRMLSYSGVTLREEQVVQIAEQLKISLNQKDNQ
tara:strand:- start:1609 stop:2319 length:711 start_codon:yes stop_codon:yes gene_type:complete